MIADYKIQLKNTNEKMRRDQEEEHRDLIPMMREFAQNVLKKLMKEENLDLYNLKKEVDELDKDKVNLQKQIVFCEKRIEDLEKFVGASAFQRPKDISDQGPEEIDSP